MKNSIKKSAFGLLSAIFISMTSISYADDIDIFDFEESPIPPNILFVLDGSRSMAEAVGSTGNNRMQTVQSALKSLINDPELDKVNIGLMSFASTIDNDQTNYDGNRAVHGPSYPVSNVLGDTDGDGVQDQTALEVLGANDKLTKLSDSFLPLPLAGKNTRQYAPHVIDQWSIGGGTPIVGALFEAAKYMRGDYLHWGNLAPKNMEAAHPSTYRGPKLADGSLTSTNVTQMSSSLKYHSPLNKECQSNAIILLSDGGPSVSRSSALVSDMIGSSYANNCNNTAKPANLYDWDAEDTIKYYGRCGTNLADFLANTDNSDSSMGHDIAGDQFINLYTIGFDLADEPDAEQYLKDLASAGGGQFYTADDKDRLVEAFKNAIGGISKQARIFSTPTYQVNKTHALLHGDSVYLPVFNPLYGTSWSGNLKKFKQVNGNLVYGPSNESIYNTEGQIKEDAQDLWATGPSNHPVTSGGAANQIDPDTRKILTDKNINNTGLIPLNASNASVSDLGASDSAEQAKLISYVKGYDTDGSTARHHMGDIIHSKPIYFPYDGLSRAKGGIVFIGTNEGYLHAINEKDGTEVFAYMPKELLKNIKVLKDSDPDDKHPYGVDGAISLRFDDANHDGKVDPGDKVMLYFGLRRGGKAYYALDVTDPTSPVLKWKIKPTTTGFSELGFTWSKPKLAKMRYGATPATKTIKPVLIFGGGYVDDNAPTNEADNSGTGSSVFIVNADTGALVWKPSTAAISYAVASNIRDIDTDRDGAVDRLYFGDTGGYIWRADLNVSDSAKNALGTYGSVKGRLYPVADLGNAGTGVTRRKFFNAPDVALFRRNGQATVSIAIGSGDRANPRDQQGDDRFFVVFDKHPLVVPETDPTPIALNDLGPRKSPTTVGWHLDLDTGSGEKVLSTAVTFQGNVIFTTFGVGATTVPTAANDCKVSGGNQSRIYVMDLLAGKAVLDLHPDKDPSDPSKPIGTIDDNDISIEGRSGMIMETPQVVFTKMTSKDGGSACIKGDCIRGFSIPGVATSQTKGASTGLKDSLPRVFWIDQN